MKAVLQDKYGPSEVLELREIDKPAPGPGQVLLRVRAAGVDQGAWHLMTGLPHLTRLGFGFLKPSTAVRGREVAGVVESVGEGVRRWQPGDEVYGTCEGSFAEYVCAKEGKLALKPAAITFEQAAAAAISGVTALQAVRDAGRVSAGQKVLVLGAGGGVGSFAVQLAKAAGADVTGVCSAAKAELVLSLGADRVIDYTREEPTAAGGQYDVVLDTAGNRPLRALRRILVPRGTLVIVGGEGGGKIGGGFDRSLRAAALNPFVRHNLKALISVENGTDLEALAAMIDAGQVAPVVDSVYPLARARAAMDHLRSGRVAGKVVLSI